MKVNEIFYSIQGEGANSGTPLIFVRFSGCNLACKFCDTDFRKYVEMSEEDIVAKVGQYADCKAVIFTGGEPLLQLNEKLCNLLHEKGYWIAVESNVLYHVEENRWNNVVSTQLNIKDIEPATPMTDQEGHNNDTMDDYTYRTGSGKKDSHSA